MRFTFSVNNHFISVKMNHIDGQLDRARAKDVRYGVKRKVGIERGFPVEMNGPSVHPVRLSRRYNDSDGPCGRCVVDSDSNR